MIEGIILPCILLKPLEGSYGLIWDLYLVSFRWMFSSMRKLSLNFSIIFSLLCFVAFPASYLSVRCSSILCTYFSVKPLKNVEKLKRRITFVLYFVASNRLALNYSVVKIIILGNLHFTFPVKFFLVP